MFKSENSRMDQGNSTKIYDSHDFASGEISSSQSINISVMKVNSELPHYSDKETNYLQESFGTTVLYSGRSYVRKFKPNKGSGMFRKKSFLDVSTTDEAGYSLSLQQNNGLHKINLRGEMLCFPSVTKLCQDMRDFEAPLTEIKDNDIRITNYPNEKELQNPVLKDLMKNMEAYYRGSESASLKTTTKKIQYDKHRDGIASMCNETLQDNVRNAVRKAGNETIWYECQKCHLEFCTPKGLANHVKTHPKVMIEKNTCVHCRKGFDNANDLSDHLHAEHIFDIMNYTCESCLVECISADLFDKHQYSCHRKQDTSCLFCSNCDKVYYDQEMLNYHKDQRKHCHICCLNYCMSSDQFKTHKEKHILFKYKCQSCNTSFITKAALTKHLEMKNLCFQILSDKGVNHAESYEFDHDQIKDFGIHSERNQEVEDNITEEIHISSTKKEKTHKCLLCTAKFALVKNMWRHVAVIHQKDLQFESLQHLPTPIGHQCNICEKKFTRKSNLVSHMATHIRGTCSIDDGQPQCSVCQKTFQKQRYLVDHMRLHTGRGTHQCRHCDKKFLRQSHLKSHMEMHDSFHKFYSCPHCDKTYMRKRDQVHHVRMIHGSAHDVISKTETVKMEGFSCSACDKKFSSVLKLQMHEVIHTATKPPYKCQECSQDFPTLSTLKRHYLIHWDLRPFSCSVCSKSFRYKQSLKRHMMTHTGEKPHVCKHCDKGFALKGTLNVHMQQHSTVRTFKCYKCETIFERKQELKSHLCSRITKQGSPAESVCTEFVYRKPNSCTTYDNHNATRKENESMANLPGILNDLTAITLVSDTCIDNLLPVTGLNSTNITGTVMPGGHLITEVNEMITINGTASNCIGETPFEVKISNRPKGNLQAPQDLEDTFEENTLLHASYFQNGKQTTVLSDSCKVMDEKNESVNLSKCSILEAKQESEVDETTIYTLITIDGELKQPTFISIPAISNSDTEENVTLQINFPEDGSEVFIIEN
ncbi:zinc finger protein 665 isoform X1 [Procambarus clarkii]|uniref:zinc finger protein 665 isoform X1 n=2 Tax=Procambarus clarkii TaxID=6728 RepID=UPI00374476DB